MTLSELIPFFAEFTASHRIPCFIFGAVGLNFWIPPRFTNDLDAVFVMEKRKLPRLVQQLRGAGFKVTSTLSRMLGEGRVIHLPIGSTRLDLKLGRSPLEREALRRSLPFRDGDWELRVATAEDMLLFKLLSWRDQDQVDARRLKRLRALDRSYLESWLNRTALDSGQPVRDRWDSL